MHLPKLFLLYILSFCDEINTIVTLSGFQLIKRRQFYLQAVTCSFPLENRKVCFFISWGGGGCGGVEDCNRNFPGPVFPRVLCYFNALKTRSPLSNGLLAKTDCKWPETVETQPAEKNEIKECWVYFWDPIFPKFP